MSSTFGYLIPDKPLNIGRFSETIISFLKNQKVINGYYEEQYQWYAAGDNSHSIFTEKGDGINPATITFGSAPLPSASGFCTVNASIQETVSGIAVAKNFRQGGRADVAETILADILKQTPVPA